MLVHHRGILTRFQHLRCCPARTQSERLERAAYALEDRYLLHGSLDLRPVDPELKAKDEAAAKAAREHIGAMQAALAEGRAPPSLGDGLPPRVPGSVTVRGAFGELTVPAALNDVRPALTALAAACTPAPFGHGHETVHDPAVRQALAMPASQFTLEGIDPAAWAQLLEDIRLALVPDAAAVEAELDKLNLYLRDGHFATHRDTPGDPSHFGTLVLCLPLVFVGGQLVVSHQGEVTPLQWDRWVYDGDTDTDANRYDLDSSSNVMGAISRVARYHIRDAPDRRRQQIATSIGKLTARQPPAKVWYAAFFGHCEHTITKVLFGARLTVAYKLRRREPAPLPLPVPPSVDAAVAYRSAAFVEVLRSLLSSPNFAPNGGRIGFACFHLYEDEHLPEAGIKGRVPNGRALWLKGADYLIAAAARALGLRVKILRIVSEGAEGDGRFAVKKLPSGTSFAEFSKPVYLADTLVAGGRRDWGVEEDTLQERLGRGDQAALDGAHWIVPLPTVKHSGPLYERTATAALPAVWYSGTGYFGNEASQTTFYTHAALLITVPPVAERQAGLPVGAGDVTTSSSSSSEEEEEEAYKKDGADEDEDENDEEEESELEGDEEAQRKPAAKRRMVAKETPAAKAAAAAPAAAKPVFPEPADAAVPTDPTAALAEALRRHVEAAATAPPPPDPEQRRIRERLHYASVGVLKELLRVKGLPARGLYTDVLRLAVAHSADMTHADLDWYKVPPTEDYRRPPGGVNPAIEEYMCDMSKEACIEWDAAYFAGVPVGSGSTYDGPARRTRSRQSAPSTT